MAVRLMRAFQRISISIYVDILCSWVVGQESRFPLRQVLGGLWTLLRVSLSGFRRFGMTKIREGGAQEWSQQLGDTLNVHSSLCRFKIVPGGSGF